MAPSGKYDGNSCPLATARRQCRYCQLLSGLFWNTVHQFGIMHSHKRNPDKLNQSRNELITSYSTTGTLAVHPAQLGLWSRQQTYVLWPTVDKISRAISFSVLLNQRHVYDTPSSAFPRPHSVTSRLRSYKTNIQGAPFTQSVTVYLQITPSHIPIQNS